MVYDDITSGQVAAGEPVKQELLTKVKDNFSNHESRIQDLEGGITTVFLPDRWNIWGAYGAAGNRTRVMITRVPFNITISAGYLMVYTAGSSGTTEIDFLFKRGGGSWTSIFSTKPSVAFGAGDNAISSNGVLNLSNVNLESGDLLRLDLTSVQVGSVDMTAYLGFAQT